MSNPELPLEFEGPFETVAKVGDIPVGEGRAYPVNGVMVAVFRTEQGYQAISDSCPHQGASLSAGWVEDGMVMCPWHAWRFRLDNGCWADAPTSPLKCATYTVRVREGEIQVCVPDSNSHQDSGEGT